MHGDGVSASDLIRSGDFDNFSVEVLSLVDELGSMADLDARQALETALGEAAQTLRLIERAGPPAGAKLLEIGSGLGLASLFLERCGFDICSLEPAGVGFDWHTEAAGVLFARLGGTHSHVAGEATQLPLSLGNFDLIFSNNVVEHIDDPLAALEFLSRRLSTDGVMFHSCPNYSFPYEPHFGVPLLPFHPRLTAKVLPKRITGTGLWQSLNFVTERQVANWAVESGLNIEFATGQLADSVERLTTDQTFALRHPQLTRIARVLVSTGGTQLLRRLPARVSTPMEFTVSHDADRRGAS